MFKKEPNRWQCKVLSIIPERIYTISVGLVIVKTIMKYFKAKRIIVSDQGLREGYIYNILEKE